MSLTTLNKTLERIDTQEKQFITEFRKFCEINYGIKPKGDDENE